MADQEQRDEMHPDATRVSQAHTSEVGTEWSTWRPLSLPMFRNLLVADLVSDMGTFMQGVGAAWLMVSQGAGPLLVALTQASPGKKSGNATDLPAMRFEARFNKALDRARKRLKIQNREGWLGIHPGNGEYLFPSELSKAGHQYSLRTAWRLTLKRAKVPYFRIYDLRSTYATRLSAGGVAVEWVTQLVKATLRPSKKYSQMKLKMQREALEKLNREANEMTTQVATPVPETGSSGTVVIGKVTNGWSRSCKIF
jgi:hypothetical protein